MFWLAAGDNNTAHFRSSLKYINHRSRIDVIMDGGGVLNEGEDFYKAYVLHYENFLSCEGDTSLVSLLICFHLD